MEYFGTDGNDLLDQDTLKIQDYTTFYGKAGDDVIRVRNGAVSGGPGNDRLEVLGDGWIPLVFPDSPAAVTVDLEAGYALDGFGTRDVLIGAFAQVNATGRDDKVYGNGRDNLFFVGGGRDVVDGRDGIDAIGLGGNEVFTVRTSVDGQTALITFPTQPGRQVELVNVEQLLLDHGPNERRLWISDFIDRHEMGALGLTGRDTQRWNAAAAPGSAAEVTFSFVATAPTAGPGAAGFGTFDATQRDAARSILALASSISGIAFREVADASSVQMRLGISQQAATKGTAFAPDQAGDAAGDVWMDTDSMLNLRPGSEGYAALMHEIGHALGLRHPRNVDAADAYAVQLRSVDDTPANTVMSSGAAPAGLFRADWGTLDVSALRSLYGLRAVNAGNDRHELSDVSASALRTIVDDGGIDTLDASGATLAAEIDLRAGHTSSIGRNPEGQSAVANVGLAAGSLVENAIGTAFDDVITGNDAGNRIEGGLGNDLLRGALGTDTAVYAAPRSAYDVLRVGDEWQVSHRAGRDGVDTLQGIERLQFDDRWVALEIAGAPTQAVRVIAAVFGKASLRPDFVGIGIGLFESGMTIEQVAQLALSTEFYLQLAGSRSHADFVRLVYRNVVGVSPSAAELAPYQALLDQGQLSPAQLAAIAAQHPLNDVQIGLVGLADTGIDYLPG